MSETTPYADLAEGYWSSLGPVKTVIVNDEFELNVFRDGGLVVWLDPIAAPQTGLCIGTGNTLKEATESARKSLAALLENVPRLEHLSIENLNQR